MRFPFGGENAGGKRLVPSTRTETRVIVGYGMNWVLLAAREGHTAKLELLEPPLCHSDAVGRCGQDRSKLGHCEIKLGTSVFCEPPESASREQTYSRPWSSALLIHQDLPAPAGPAVALSTNFARILSVPDIVPPDFD
jgi:hypothetical protein